MTCRHLSSLRVPQAPSAVVSFPSWRGPVWPCAAARRPGQASKLVEPVSFDFYDPTTFPAAFGGIETAPVVRPPALSRVRDLAPALRAGSAAGLRHVVFLSVQGADKIPFLPHAGIERWLRTSSMAWTFLRPSFFVQNLVPSTRPRSVSVES